MQELNKKYFELYNQVRAYEKGQFHQCMPNPGGPRAEHYIKAEMITVQLV